VKSSLEDEITNINQVLIEDSEIKKASWQRRGWSPKGHKLVLDHKFGEDLKV
jgi:hypothetical protein